MINDRRGAEIFSETEGLLQISLWKQSPDIPQGPGCQFVKTPPSWHFQIKDSSRTGVICHICWIHQAGSPESLKDSRCLGQEKKACNNKMVKNFFTSTQSFTCELCATLRKRGKALIHVRFTFLRQRLTSHCPIDQSLRKIPADCSNSSVWREGTQGKGK